MQEIQTYLASQKNLTVIADLVKVESGKDNQNRPAASEQGILVLRQILESRLRTQSKQNPTCLKRHG